MSFRTGDIIMGKYSDSGSFLLLASQTVMSAGIFFFNKNCKRA